MKLPTVSDLFAARAPDRIDRLIATALAVLTAAVLLATTSSLGYARDEGFYVHAARAYGRWFDILVSDPGLAFSRATTDAVFAVNREHPTFMKALFALSGRGLSGTSLEEGTTFRVPTMLLAGLLSGVLYTWARRFGGRVAGLLAALLLLFMPRWFYHAHLACFDVPIAAMWTFSALAFVRSGDPIAGDAKRRASWRFVVAAVCFGLALNTKHNAWFLPVAALVYIGLLQLLARRSGPPTVQTPRRLLAGLAALSIGGPIVAWLGWPWLWHDTSARLRDYVQFHVQHVFYNMEFLGQNYFEPPFPRSYAPLMTFATVPAITIVLSLVGLLFWGRRLMLRQRRRERVDMLDAHGLFWLLAIGVSFGPWVFDTTPIFGGTKHWATAYPFGCLFAGLAGAKVLRGTVAWSRLRLGRRHTFGAAATGVGLLLMPAALSTFQSHPWGLSAYTPIVGGAPGAATLGLNRTFWGYTTGSVVDYLNEHAPPNAQIYIHDTLSVSWSLLQQDGRLRKDLQVARGVTSADIALYHHERHMRGQEQQAWLALGTFSPSLVRGPNGVPVVLVYTRRQ